MAFLKIWTILMIPVCALIWWNSFPYETVDRIVRHETLACMSWRDTQKWSGHTSGESREETDNLISALSNRCRTLQIGEVVKYLSTDDGFDLIISKPFARDYETEIWILTGHLGY